MDFPDVMLRKIAVIQSQEELKGVLKGLKVTEDKKGEQIPHLIVPTWQV